MLLWLAGVNRERLTVVGAVGTADRDDALPEQIQEKTLDLPLTVIGTVPGERLLQDPAGGVGSLVTVQHLQQSLLLDGKDTVADKFVAGRCRRDGLRHAATPGHRTGVRGAKSQPPSRPLVAC